MVAEVTFSNSINESCGKTTYGLKLHRFNTGPRRWEIVLVTAFEILTVGNLLTVIQSKDVFQKSNPT